VNVLDGLTEIQAKHGQEILAYGGVWICGDNYCEIKKSLYVQLNWTQQTKSIG
jgi:hypothetical protein